MSAYLGPSWKNTGGYEKTEIGNYARFPYLVADTTFIDNIGGPTGAIGYTGSTGPTGAVGYTGHIGPTGISYSAGQNISLASDIISVKSPLTSNLNIGTQSITSNIGSETLSISYNILEYNKTSVNSKSQLQPNSLTIYDTTGGSSSVYSRMGSTGFICTNPTDTLSIGTTTLSKDVGSSPLYISNTNSPIVFNTNTLQFGSGLQSNTAGSSSGVYLSINVNGTNYKINLLTP
jgi:hypothetical protein